MTVTTSTPAVRDDLMSVYLRQWKMLRSLLKKRTGSHELAEEALQETWLRLAGRPPEPTMIHDRQAFILRVAGNIAVDLARKEKRHSSRCISDEAVLKTAADSYPSPETFAIDRDQLRFLALALAQLPPKPRAALLMNRCDGLSHSQIGSKLGVSESMVARYLAQALRHCRDHFRDRG
jgi:RNA polymerase sigma factor (sigma-70 family)